MKVQDLLIPPDQLALVKNCLSARYSDKPDPWGLDIDQALKYLKYLYPLYKSYFKVRVFGAQNVPDKQFIFVGNHTGQIAFDAMLVSMSGVLELKPPRILRGMVERWMAGLPFISRIAAESGSILGDRHNSQYLLEHGESLLVFPEGVKGIAKNTKDFYKMKDFSQGFMRMALQTQTPILPLAVVGAEEFYPYVHHFKTLEKLLKLPALPITPLTPLLGPLSLLPLPAPVDIYYGKPINLPKGITHDAPDEVIDSLVAKVQEKVDKMVVDGLKVRRPFLEKYGLKDLRRLKRSVLKPTKTAKKAEIEREEIDND